MIKLALTLLSLSLLLPAQTSFGPPQTINGSAASPRSVHAADLDGDGDADTLVASVFDNAVSWYENLGAGSFGAQQVITTSTMAPLDAHAIDLDGDGDQDVLSASYLDDKIAWYENLGGGSFGPQLVLTTSADGAESVYASDLDGDGDPDVLSASSLDHTIAWHSNLGGGNFGPRQVIHSGANFARSVHAGDLDGDGDIDVLAGFTYWAAWYENLGGGTFAPPQALTPFLEDANDVLATDLDGDGDADVLFGSYDFSIEFGKVAWRESLGGGNFGPPQVIGGHTWNRYEVFAADFDADGDRDVVAAVHDSDSFGCPGDIEWYENLGSGGFGPRQHIAGNTPCPSSVHAEDLDGDGDVDVLFNSGSLVAWCRNLLPPITPNLGLTAPLTAPIGAPLAYTLTTTPARPGAGYVFDISLEGDSPGLVLPPPLTGSIPLNPPFIACELAPLLPGVFLGFTGNLDATGAATPTLVVPAAPHIVGVQIFAAGLTLDPLGPFGLGVISNGVATTIGP